MVMKGIDHIIKPRFKFSKRSKHFLSLIFVSFLLSSCVGKLKIKLETTNSESNTPPKITLISDRFFVANGSDSSILSEQDVPTLIAEVSDIDSDDLQIDCLYERIGLSASDPRSTNGLISCAGLQTLKKHNDVWLTESLSVQNGIIEWNPLGYQAGLYRFTVSAFDGKDTAQVSFVRDPRLKATS